MLAWGQVWKLPRETLILHLVLRASSEMELYPHLKA